MGPFHQEPDEISRREIEVNLIGTVIGSRLAVQRMLPRRHGHLVNIASGVGPRAPPGSSVYSATSTASSDSPNPYAWNTRAAASASRSSSPRRSGRR